ncbi:DUF2272 domain-containing protein [Rhizobium leguminosarum]|uniref:DUF2272 domain-containing protein n=1 Tax=Rhizobium leguminosarum TaxID=384 RepID=UPI0014423650|nr:DUF2272 domain-containing protein [Rhizobium leguminosarum]NKL66292.1 DUF2272 domain-containing protein [Rhizobium leguminosarum bv. viciae]
MGPLSERLIDAATQEWEFFGYSSRALNNKWKIGGDEHDPPYRERVQRYWSVVGHPTWDGRTKQPWSGAFISWCFDRADYGSRFEGSAKHSIYIDWIRRGGSADTLDLVDPQSADVEPGDLIWNSRRDETTSNIPQNYTQAIARLQAGDFFISHVDIIVGVGDSEFSSIGGNVSNEDPGGSVTKSTWRINGGRIADPRKSWIGLVKNRG